MVSHAHQAAASPCIDAIEATACAFNAAEPDNGAQRYLSLLLPRVVDAAATDWALLVMMMISLCQPGDSKGRRADSSCTAGDVPVPGVNDFPDLISFGDEPAIEADDPFLATDGCVGVIQRPAPQMVPCQALSGTCSVMACFDVFDGPVHPQSRLCFTASTCCRSEGYCTL